VYLPKLPAVAFLSEQWGWEGSPLEPKGNISFLGDQVTYLNISAT